MSLPDDVRAHAARVVDGARWVRIDEDALTAFTSDGPVPEPALDPESHYLEGGYEAVARYLLSLDVINFGSGWFPTLRKRQDPASGRPLSGYNTVAWGLTDRFRLNGPWTNDELRAVSAIEIAAVLGQSADHELMSLYAQALRQFGAFLGDADVLEFVTAAKGSAVTFATNLARGMPMFRDTGFFKRAQIAPADLALAGIGTWTDLDALTIFADNLVPHVLRCEGVLVYDPQLAEHIDARHILGRGWELQAEEEIRASAVAACARLAPQLGVSERVLDAWLWNRGQDPAIKAHPRHRRCCVYY
jgi:Potential Queuosine, Q, salvage protein family